MDQGKYGEEKYKEEKSYQGSYVTQAESWVCPACETINSQDKCVVCGYQNEHNVDNVKSEKKKRPSYVLALAACLVAVIFLALSMMLKRNAAELPKDSNAGQMTEPKAVIQETVGKFRYALISDSIPPDEPYGYGYTYPAFGGKYLRPQISSITFMASIEDAVDSWDVSENQDGTVLAWVEPNGNLYDLYIGAEGGVMAPQNCESLFAYYVNVESIDFNGCFNTCSVRDMNSMFAYCEKLARLDLRSFNTGKVRNMYCMFEHCMNLVSLDVSDFDTSNVDLMFNMFSYCERLLELDVSMFDTSNVSNMGAMFQGCASLRSLDLTNFDTSSVWDMRYMFEYCNPEIELDVSSFDVTYVTEYEHFMPSGMKVNGRPWEEFFNEN